MPEENMEAQFLDRAQLMVSGCRKVGARPRNTFSPGGLCTSQGTMCRHVPVIRTCIWWDGAVFVLKSYHWS